MNKKLLIAAAGAAIALLAVTVTASPWSSNTPLYTYRMEQVSSKMNFLPTEQSIFAYTTEKGCTLDYTVLGSGHIQPAEKLTTRTCEGETCSSTCPNTCVDTCPNTCSGATCPNTCDQYTCEVCVTISTCVTCGGGTCDPPCG
jgi:hypothetical protein